MRMEAREPTKSASEANWLAECAGVVVVPCASRCN